MLNIALIQAAYLSGLIPRLYYTFVANIRRDGKYLQPFSRNESEFDYREIYVLPTTFDERYRYLLEVLKALPLNKEWMSRGDLLSRLKSRAPHLFESVGRQAFVRDFLNVMPGIRRKGSRTEGQEDVVQLSPEGKHLLKLLDLPWFQALLRREPISDNEVITQVEGLNIQELQPA